MAEECQIIVGYGLCTYVLSYMMKKKTSELNASQTSQRSVTVQEATAQLFKNDEQKKVVKMEHHTAKCNGVIIDECSITGPSNLQYLEKV